MAAFAGDRRFVFPEKFLYAIIKSIKREGWRQPIMKMIHCADLHLDAKMKTHLDGMQAKERRLELLGTFGRLVSYAAEHYENNEECRFK